MLVRGDNPEPVRVAGFTEKAWISMWFASHAPTGMGGYARVAWPDGGCLLAQPAIVVEVFSVITKLVYDEMKRQQEASRQS